MKGRAALVAAGSAAAVVLLSGCSHDSERIHVFGRNYDRGDGPLSLAAAQSQFGSDVVIVAHGKQVAGQRGPNVPTVILVRIGSNYYAYALSGGP